MMKCPDLNDLAGYIDKILESPDGVVHQDSSIENHLRSCRRCLSLMASMLAESDACSSGPPESGEEIQGRLADNFRGDTSRASARSGTEAEEMADTLFSARKAPRISLGFAEEGIRVEQLHQARLHVESLFGENLSITRLLRRPVLPRQSIDLTFRAGELLSASFLPRPGGLSVRFTVAEDSPADELEIYDSGRLLRNAYRDEKGAFSFNNIPENRTHLVRNTETGEILLVLQCHPVQLEPGDLARLAIYLASQGRLEEAADVFNCKESAGLAGSRIAKLYHLIRYGAALYPRELALLRKKRGKDQNRSGHTVLEAMPVFLKIPVEEHPLPELKQAVDAGINKNWPEADRLFQLVVDASADPLLLAAAGWAALANDENERAEALFKRALVLAPEQEDAVAGLEYANRIQHRKARLDNAEQIISDILAAYSKALEQEEDADPGLRQNATI